MTRVVNRRELVIGSAVGTMLGPLRAARATAPPAGKEAPGIYRYRIGGFEITRRQVAAGARRHRPTSGRIRTPSGSASGL
jgi:hypothetical protein